MTQKCPQCNNLIPSGNDICNLCGFNYQKHLQEKQATNTKRSSTEFNPKIFVTIGILIAIFTAMPFFVNFAGSFFSKYIAEQGADEIMELTSLLPVIFPIMIAVVLFIIFFIMLINSISKRK